MKLITALLSLLAVSSISTSYAYNTVYKYTEPKAEQSRDVFYQTLGLFAELKNEKYVSSLLIKDPRNNIVNKDKRYKVKLCELVQVIEDEKAYMKANMATQSVSIVGLEKYQDRLEKEIGESCEELFKWRNW
ncbi:hypothetical protein [Acinetobacter baumannii]|uniref:hypothetical protein n=1 Tax=Acinetobacter baumannii TaxID=470 RepID=UPI00051A6E2B|nr:hypothetical protein [Acinetobacter baumannii]KIQ71713.1 hypothetical protein SE99_03517 [Acinetobacter baumannii]